MPGLPRRSQCSIRSAKSWQPQPTPPSRKREVQIGEAPRHAAEEQRLGDGVAGVGKMADMVEGEIARRIAQAEAAAAGVEGRRDAELAAFLPERRRSHGRCRGRAGRKRRMTRTAPGSTPSAAGTGRAMPLPNMPTLAPSCFGDEFELGDRLVGRVHRDDRRRGQPVAELGEIVGGDDVEAADHGAPRLVVGDARDAEAGGRIDRCRNRCRTRRAGRRACAASSRWRGRACWWMAPPIAFHGDAALLALGDREAKRIGNAPLAGEKAVRRLVAGGLAHLLGEDRRVLDPMAVGVDDRVAEFRVDLFRARVTRSWSASR